MKDERLKKIGQYIRQIHHFQKYLINKKINDKKIGITYEQAWVLMLLYNHNGVNQQEIANLCYKEKSTILRLIDALERMNYVTRQRDKNDRRNNNIFITKSGALIQKEIMSMHIELLYSLFEGLSDETIDKAEHVVFQIHQNLYRASNQLSIESSICERKNDAI